MARRKQEEELKTDGMNLSEEIQARLKKDVTQTMDSVDRRYLSSGITLLDLSLSTQLIINNEGQRVPLLGRGIPAGCVTTILGEFGGGKSTLLSTFLASGQKQHGESILFDYEPGGVTDSLLSAAGVDTEKLHKSSPIWGEEGLTFAANLIKDKVNSQVPIVIGFDSMGAMNFKNTEKKSYYETPQVAYRASMMQRFFSDISGFMSASKNTYLFFTNYLKKELNIGGPPKHGPPADAYVCKGQLGQYSNIILKMKNIDSEKDKVTDVVKYVTLQIEYVKDKYSNERGRKFPVFFYVNAGGLNIGLDDPKTSLEYLITRGVFKRVTDQSYTVMGEAMTKNKIRKEMYSNPDFYAAVRQMVVNTYLEDRSLTLTEINEEEEIES